MQFVINLLINAFAVFIAAYILPGVHIRDFFTAIVVSIVIGISNTLLKPILVILTLPITVLTLGLFYVIINGLLILFTSAVVPGFSVKNLWWAILFSFVLSLVNWVLNSLSK
jgi:putative membrane protein